MFKYNDGTKMLNRDHTSMADDVIRCVSRKSSMRYFTGKGQHLPPKTNFRKIYLAIESSSVCIAFSHIIQTKSL